MAEHRAGAGESVGDLIGRERAVLAFPFGNTPAASVEAEAVGGGLGDPCAHGGALRCCCLVDGVGEFGGK